MEIIPMEPLMTIDQAAELLQVPASWIYKQTSAGGSFPFLKLGAKHLRFRRSEIERWLEESCHRGGNQAVKPSGTVPEGSSQAIQTKELKAA
jgi:excisionase family DNA binding protein